MLKPEIEEFAKLLIKEVRDRSILSCDSQLNPQSNSPIALRWRKNLRDPSSNDLAVSMIPDCVDEVLFHLLHAIDSGLIHLSFVAGNGNSVDLTKDGIGELAGWYMMVGGGWRSEFSQQRFANDFEDLEGFNFDTF